MSKSIDISDIRAIDRQLRKLEESFKKKLDAFWSDYEKDVSKQISKLKAGVIQKIKLKDSKLTGLEKLYKEYFRAVDKIVQRITRADLLKNAKNSEEIKRLNSLKVDKSQTDYLVRAKELSRKQYDDYQDILNKKFDDAEKIKPLMSANEYKKIVADETQKFKNVRLNLSAEYESNRIANNIREELAVKSGLVIGIVFNAIVDNRTTQHICLPRHKVVLKINDKRLIYFRPPLHPHCRSYWTYIYKGSNVKFTSNKEIDYIIAYFTIDEKLTSEISRFDKYPEKRINKKVRKNSELKSELTDKDFLKN